MKKKRLLITLFVSLFLFCFVFFLIYVVYCFAFYDKNQVTKYVDEFNHGYYDFVYNSLADNDKVGKEDFNKSINLMFNESKLGEIHDTYYPDIDKDLFIDNFLFNTKVETGDITFVEDGKTGLFTRKSIKYGSINLSTKGGIRTSFVVRKNIKLTGEANSKIFVDDKECDLNNNSCYLVYVLGGMHTIRYETSKVTYFGLFNVTNDNMEIDVTTIDSLVKTSEVKGVTKKQVEKITLKPGKYLIKECYLPFDCAKKAKSFLILEADGSANLYMWYNLAQAGDSYFGTYVIENNYLILKFNNHTYKEFDYDTKVTTTIDIDVYSEFRYKVINNKKIKNEEYTFVWSE